jgi:predicted ribosomally synthesized peptide with nif11-like leader
MGGLQQGETVMSLADAQRFCADVASNKQLNDKVKPMAAGLASIVAAAKTHGYDFTLDELKQAIRERARRELSDAHLEAIAGGGAPPAVQTSQVQAVVFVGQTVDSFATITSQAAAQVNAVVQTVLI